ncbi:esterase-like activity of phytase family protein [Ketobacter alkanivorans]|uniref:Alkaline phosphatase n=1 Tax=Ketobacter alkanivorans TaxID=1917421 RepID=A0A2K9LKV9_9GAMM|nr:esterase-like activity of phytase family protein [Ketobacter alkanivorans]AUM12893.1 alkaline phosphatase [Ketobacter alkanivorans]
MPSCTTRTLIKSALALSIAAVSAHTMAGNPHHKIQWQPKKDAYFERVATFPVYHNLNLGNGDAVEDQTAAEISAASQDGNVVFYSDSPMGRIGLIDIRNIAAPKAAGFITLDGEPTSVAVNGDHLLVAINTSSSYTTPGGKLSVYSLANPLQPQWIADFDMGGQPDAIATSPDGRYAAVVVENERDEDYNDGIIPQAPAGNLQVITMRGAVTNWKVRAVDLTGLAQIAPSDPEPEYVAINRFNIAAVTLQENNHIVLVDLRRARIIHDFSAGSVDLFNVDTSEDDVINPVDTILDRRREPDAITWINDWWIGTANEGDYEDEHGVAGGSRGFTLFNPFGRVKYEAGASLEHALIRAGHYPESRSENKGIEPESILSGTFDGKEHLFVGSERGNIVAVYNTSALGKPKLHQLLPTTIAPEGLLTIPSRNLLVVSSEEDSAEDGIRSTVAIYQYGAKYAEYPQIQSDPNQLIPWGALSGMVGDNDNAQTLYAVPDSYYAQSRIFRAEVAPKGPAVIKQAIVLSKDGSTVDYDLEGIAQRQDGSFWLVSEGNSGSRPNLLIKAAADGSVMEEISLPASVVAKQISNGFEGVAVTGSGEQEKVYIAFQREWKGDPAGMVRIGVYTPSTNSWGFLYYPIESTDTGWIGLSELSAIDEHNFAVIERDNQQGDRARVKRLYRFSVADLTPAAEGETFPQVSKSLAYDLLPELQATHGWVLDKVEGTAIAKNGEVYVVTDNDGVDDASGETRFMKLGKLFK